MMDATGRIVFDSTIDGLACRLSAELYLPQPRDEVFAFFADATRLEDLTPPWLHFHVLTPPPIHMHEGTLIDYRLRVHGLPMRWQSRISVWDPPYQFVDEQTRGPYRLWRHAHQFEVCGSGTLCRDIVEYRAPGGWLVDRVFVRADLRKIFSYRQRRLAELFPAVAAA
jgi:ligand-binding SRPBCC domain-containing protein